MLTFEPEILQSNSTVVSTAVKILVSRTFYAVALAGFGIQHFLFGEYIAGRAPAWPEGAPGKALFAYVTGAILVMTSIAIIIGRKARLALFISGFIIIAWAAVRNIYTLALNPEYGGLLTNLFKSLSIGFGAFIVAETFAADEREFPSDRIGRTLAIEGVYMVGLFLLVGGIQHFIFVEFVKFLVPAWIPGPAFWTYFAGVALAAAGIGIVFKVKRELAATLAGIMVFIWFLILHLPRAIEAGNQNEWTAVFEALGVSGLLLLIGQRSGR